MSSFSLDEIPFTPFRSFKPHSLLPMTPVVRLISGRASGHVLYRQEDKLYESDNPDEKNKTPNINDNNNRSSKNNSNNNNNNGDNDNSGSKYPQSPTSSAIEIVKFSSVESSTTPYIYTAVASSSSTSSSFIPTSTFSSPSSFATPTSRTSSSSSKFSSSFPSTLSSSIPPSPSPSINDALGLSTSPQRPNHHSLLGSIVAIILGCLFCIVITLVIYVITRPKFGSLARLWKKSKVTSTRSSFEKDFRFPQRQSDFNLPESRPMSRSLLLPSFHVEGTFNEGGHGIVIPRSPPAASTGFPDECRTHTRMMSSRTSTSASRLSSSGVSRQPSRKHRSMNRIISILDGYPFEHEGNGEGASRSTNWAAADHHDAPNFSRSSSHGTTE